MDAPEFDGVEHLRRIALEWGRVDARDGNDPSCVEDDVCAVGRGATAEEAFAGYRPGEGVGEPVGGGVDVCQGNAPAGGEQFGTLFDGFRLGSERRAGWIDEGAEDAEG